MLSDESEVLDYPKVIIACLVLGSQNFFFKKKGRIKYSIINLQF